jgi:phosphate transport system protein
MDDTRAHFSERLAHVQQSVLRMGTLVEESIRKAMRALVEKDLQLAELVIDEDQAINRMELEIQDECVAIIATEQPVASDLRGIITNIKITTQLERMGDHARHIAKTAKELANQTLVKKLIDIPRMADAVVKMLHQVLTAYMHGDAEHASRVSSMDDEVDELHDQVLRELMTYMMEDPANIAQSISLLLVSRFLERLGDHVTNIAEWIYYDSRGEHIELNP